MPPPTNITPETAIVITSLPYDVTLDPTGLPSSTYVADCDSHVFLALWWKYTPPTDVSAVGVVYGSVDPGANYSPLMSMWAGIPPALTQLPNRCFTTDVDGNGYVSTNVTPGVACYFQVTNRLSGAPLTEMTFHIERHDDVDASAGSFVVSNDTDGFPLAVILRDGTLAQILGVEPFEQAEWLSSGLLAVVSESTSGFFARALTFYNQTLHFMSDVPGVLTDGISAVFSPITSNRVDTFYVVDNQLPTSAFLKTVTADGVVTTGADMLAEVGPIGGSGTNNGGGIGLSPDGTILYLIVMASTSSFFVDSIGRWDLVHEVALAPLVTFTASTLRAGNDLPVMADGSVLIPVVNNSGTPHWNVRRYAADGSLLNTYLSNTNGAGQPPRLRRDPADDAVFWSMVWPTNTNPGTEFHIEQIRLSDGVILETVTQFVKEGGTPDQPLYGVSSSCPLLLTPSVPTPPVPTFHTRILRRRRVRRSPIIWNEKQGLQTQVRVNLFAVDMQPGVGTADVPNPLVMIRASKDGGRTWGNERLIELGRVGEYTQRLNTWQWGQGRQWVFEVSVSDPVTAVLVNAYIDAEGGNS